MCVWNINKLFFLLDIWYEIYLFKWNLSFFLDNLRSILTFFFIFFLSLIQDNIFRTIWKCQNLSFSHFFKKQHFQEHISFAIFSQEFPIVFFIFFRLFPLNTKHWNSCFEYSLYWSLSLSYILDHISIDIFIPLSLSPSISFLIL